MDCKPSPRRQRVSAEERSRFVSLYRASGLTQVEFAQQQGINLSTLRQWLYRSGLKKKRKARARFHELPVSTLLSPAWLAEIALDSGITLRLSGVANPDWLSCVVNILRQKPC